MNIENENSDFRILLVFFTLGLELLIKNQAAYKQI